MHISRVLIQNFRNFKELLIDPYPRAAVVTGVNGVGKSNLLRALRLALDPSLPDTARKLSTEDICDQANSSLAAGVDVRVEVDISGFGDDNAVSTVFGDCFINEDPLTARITYIFQPEPGRGTPGRLTADDYDWLITGGPVDRADARLIRRDVPLSVLPPLRDVVRDLSRWRDSPLHDLLAANPPNAADLKTVAETIQEAMNKIAADGPMKKLAASLKQQLDNLAGPQMDLTPTLGFAPGTPDQLLRETQLYIDAERRRSISEASSGHANVMYLALLLERFATRRQRNSALDSLLAVEEPEAHLHPVLQRQLFRALLRQEDTSLTVTTHSPNIAAVSPLDSIVLLRDVPGHGTVAFNAAHAGLTAMQQLDIERYLTVSRAEVLFCRAAILVEGLSEAYLLPALARVLGFDLDAHGVVLADVAGTDFGPYRDLLGPNALDVPHVIVTDGDPVRRVREETQYVYAGLRRAAKLAPETEGSANPLSELIDRMTGGDSPDRLSTARLWAADWGDVFVGLETLEIDIVPLLAYDMIDAFADFGKSAEATDSFNAAVGAIIANVATPADHAELIRRIADIGKGRYAQRLAGYVEKLGAHWFEAMLADRDMFHTHTLTGFPAAEAPPDFVPMETLMAAGSFGYLFAALDRVSWMVRDRGLLPVTDDSATADPDA
jgi:putative ATP-dependent endonuclease of the OLD family